MIDTRSTMKDAMREACQRLADAMDARAAYDERMARVVTPKGVTLYTVRRSMAGRA